MPALQAAALAQLLILVFCITTAAARDPLPAACDKYTPLYKSIDRDLDLFKRKGGITPNLLYRTMTMHTAGYREKGLAVAFYHGKAYVISNVRHINLQRFGHHVELWAAYLKVMLQLQQQYGASLPNVEFVWHTIDRPVRLTANSSDVTDYPVLRFCKSAAHPDILIPNFHFYMKKYQSNYLDRMDQINTELPWAARAQVLFARFSGYDRYVHPDDPHTQRLGAGGAPLCRWKGTTTAICPVRDHLQRWARNYSGIMDISCHNHRPMKDHALYRYVLHVDGQGLSSKLEMLLALGSLVMKEESGYMAYYHHLLEPYKHYIPVWKRGAGPEDILAAVEWARAHDDDAHQMALAAQALAGQYLSAEARACFWLKLLEAYGSTMTYDPVEFRKITVGEDGQVGGTWRYIKPAQQFLDEEVTKYFPTLMKELVWEP